MLADGHPGEGRILAGAVYRCWGRLDLNWQYRQHVSNCDSTTGPHRHRPCQRCYADYGRWPPARRRGFDGLKCFCYGPEGCKIWLSADRRVQRGHLMAATVPWCWHAVMVDCSWNVMAHGDAREGKWRGNCRMQWVASTLHTTSEHGVSSITTADADTSAASSRLNWRLAPI